MKQTITQSAFLDAFNALRPDNFSYDGLRALFDHLEEHEKDSGEELELDVIAICYDFCEGTDEEIAQNYGIDGLDDCDDDDEEKHALVIDYLESEGALVADLETTILYRSF